MKVIIHIYSLLVIKISIKCFGFVFFKMLVDYLLSTASNIQQHKIAVI
jgi:hypothetical protein